MDYRQIEKARREQDKLYKKIKPLIEEGNISELQQIKDTYKWNLNEMYNSQYPLNMAIKHKKAFEWLIGNGADINNNHLPVLHDAFRSLDMELVEYLMSQGADINIKRPSYDYREGSDVLYGLTYEIADNPVEKIIEFIKCAQDHGYSIKESAGLTFKALVYNVVRSSPFMKNKSESDMKNWVVIKYLVAEGVDVNYNKNNQVFTRNDTALHIAASNNHLGMCKYLIECGADIEKVNGDGKRAYHLAYESGCEDAAEFLKSIEPPHYHDSQFNYNRLVEIGLPKPILDISVSTDRSYEFYKTDDSIMVTVHGYMDDEEVSEKFSLFDTYNFKGISFLDVNNVISLNISGSNVMAITLPDEVYSMTFYYNLDTNKISLYDMEHGNFDDIADVSTFLNVLKQR